MITLRPVIHGARPRLHLLIEFVHKLRHLHSVPPNSIPQELQPTHIFQLAIQPRKPRKKIKKIPRNSSSVITIEWEIRAVSESATTRWRIDGRRWRGRGGTGFRGAGNRKCPSCPWRRPGRRRRWIWEPIFRRSCRLCSPPCGRTPPRRGGRSNLDKSHPPSTSSPYQHSQASLFCISSTTRN